MCSSDLLLVRQALSQRLAIFMLRVSKHEAEVDVDDLRVLNRRWCCGSYERFLFGGKTGDFEIDADLADFLGTGPAPTGWPTEKLVQRLATAPENRKLVVLVTSGAMSPVTRGHVQMLHAAKERMERAGYVAIGAYLLPTSDEAKGLPELSQAFCDNVAELSVCDDELVAATSLEAVGLGGRPRDEVKPRHLVHALRDELLQRYQLSLEGRNLHAFYVVGEDSEIGRAHV